MTEDRLIQWLLLLHRPIPFDPIPPWLKLGKEQSDKFQEVQKLMNAKIAEIEHEKLVELNKIAGGELLK